MPTLRERFEHLFPGPRAVARLNTATEALLSVYQRRNLLGGDMLSEQYDPRLLDNFIRHMGDVKLSGADDSGEPTEADRLLAVDEARYLYHYDPVSRHSIRMWTNFGLGTDPQIIVENENQEEGDEEHEQETPPSGPSNSAPQIWEECWTARRNAPLFKRRRQGRMSDRVLTDGELFFAAFFNRKSPSRTQTLPSDELDIDVVPKGGSTIRLIDTKQITELVCDPEDEETVCYYKREWLDEVSKQQLTRYYESWDAHKSGASSRIELPDGAEVQKDCYVLHAEHNTIGLRGWPITASGAAWLRAYKQFMQNRVTIAASKAMFVRQLITQGGSRAVDALKSFFASDYQTGGDIETNPAAVAGSSLLTNKAVEYKDLPLGTGAGDASEDGAALLAQAGLTFDVFPHYLGRGEAYRLATASAMESPIRRTWSAYQQWWSDVFTDLVYMVLGIWEEVNAKNLEAYTVTVQIDPLVDTDVSDFADAIVPMHQDGLVPDEQAMLLSLQALGVEDAQQITDETMAQREEKDAAKQMQPEPQPQLPDDIAQELRAIGEMARQMLDPEAEENLRQESARALAMLGESVE